MEQEFQHTPVMLNEVIHYLDIHPDGVYLDGTVGGAGHSLEIAKQLRGGRLYCLDKDPEAVEAAGLLLAGYGNVSIVEGDFREVDRLLDGLSFDGALLDLGVSSHQLDTDERGFSYLKDSPLDMRMTKRGIGAEDIVNNYSEAELVDIIFRYGEERYARYIARKIAAERQTEPIKTTARLAEIVISALPPDVRRKEKNPARKTFTAIRIETNDELEALNEGIDAVFGMLNGGARFLIISFHSLEDRIVKQKFNELSRGCICPPEFPVCVCGRKPEARVITRKPIVASEKEQDVNRRSRSAKLRILQKL